MTREDMILQELAAVRRQMAELTRAIAPRITREQLCHRRGCHRNTITALIERGVVPRPDSTGKFLLSEVIEFETMEAQRLRAA